MKQFQLLIIFFLFWPVILHSAQSRNFKLGIENIAKKELSMLKKGKVGLIANQTSINQRGNRTVDLLRQKGVNVRYLFAPEHGSKGNVQAEQMVNFDVDVQTNIPFISLYGAGARERFVRALDDIDTICFDLQDCGMRHYTYISTLYRTMEDAAHYNKKFIVFDRPNPLGGTIEGPLVEDGLRSFISIAPIPLRHGLTIGELALYFNEYVLLKKIDLRVIKMKKYRKSKPIQLHTFLSPNLKTINACYGYRFLGLLGEVRPFDVGVGTDHAFQFIGLPAHLNVPSFWDNMQVILKEHGIHAKKYSYLSARKKKQMHGLLLHDHGNHDDKRFPVFIEIIRTAYAANISLSFSPAFDKAVGASWVKKQLLKKIASDVMLKRVHSEHDTYIQRVATIALY